MIILLPLTKDLLLLLVILKRLVLLQPPNTTSTDYERSHETCQFFVYWWCVSCVLKINNFDAKLKRKNGFVSHLVLTSIITGWIKLRTVSLYSLRTLRDQWHLTFKKIVYKFVANMNPQPSLMDKNKDWQLELLMEKLRSKASQLKSFSEISKNVRMTMLVGYVLYCYSIINLLRYK